MFDEVDGNGDSHQSTRKGLSFNTENSNNTEMEKYHVDEVKFPWETNLPSVEIRASSSAMEVPRRPRTATWPPSCPFICHDIEHDLKGVAKPIARRSYFYWQCMHYFLFLVGMIQLLLNGISAISLTYTRIWSIKESFISIFLFLVYPLVGFFTWHFSLYTALRVESAFFFTFWLISFTLHLILVFCMIIGFQIIGSGGIRMLFQTYSITSLYEISLQIGAVFFSVLFLLLGIIHMRRVWTFLMRGMHHPSQVHP